MSINPPPLVKPRRRLAVIGIVLGALLSLSPVFGVIGSMLSMIGAFHELAGAGISDPHALSTHISRSLFSTATGVFLFPVGVVVLTVSIMCYVRRNPTIPPPLP